ncbi:MAG: hypothetical protein NTX09_09965 [Verrucomicrobia bacterium]|nr:hypothetical protein [Verrucomicrobiota bacterium]
MKSLRLFVSVALLTATAVTVFAVEKLDCAMVAVRSSETFVISAGGSSRAIRQGACSTSTAPLRAARP